MGGKVKGLNNDGLQLILPTLFVLRLVKRERQWALTDGAGPRLLCFLLACGNGNLSGV